MPPLLASLVRARLLGEKTGGGFYRRVKTAAGSTILALDPATLEYRESAKPRLPSLEAAAGIEDAGARIRTLFLGKDRVGDFLRRTLGATLVYAARIAPEIADSIDDVDRAMQLGLRLGARAVRDVGRHRREEVIAACGLDAAVLGELPGLNGPACSESAPARSRHAARLADGTSPRRSPAASSRATRARVSSISATACCASSSTPR